MNDYKRDEDLEEYGQIDDKSSSMNVNEFPPRKEAHRGKDKRKSRVQKRKKKKTLKFPLVRILLVLFLFLVVTMVTYPIWVQRL